MAPGPCANLSCCGHGCGVPTHCDCSACSQARRARRGGKVLCRAGRAEQLAYSTIFIEGLDMGHINVSAFYSALLRRGLGRTSPFVHQLTPTDVETHYKMVFFAWSDFFFVFSIFLYNSILVWTSSFLGTHLFCFIEVYCTLYLYLVLISLLVCMELVFYFAWLQYVNCLDTRWEVIVSTISPACRFCTKCR